MCIYTILESHLYLVKVCLLKIARERWGGQIHGIQRKSINLKKLRIK